MNNDPTKWSIEVRLRGDELCTLVDALETHLEACHYPDSPKAKSVEELLTKLTEKWEVNA